MDKDEIYMNLAIAQANKSLSLSEVPVGAVIVFNDAVIAESHNRLISNVDPSAHAEINAIREASRVLGNYRLLDAEIYVTLQPCLMCYGAIVNARIKRIVFGAFDSKDNSCLIYNSDKVINSFNHKPEIKGGVLESECGNILRKFFKSKRL